MALITRARLAALGAGLALGLAGAAGAAHAAGPDAPAGDQVSYVTSTDDCPAAAGTPADA
jgi:hypothetical protein